MCVCVCVRACVCVCVCVRERERERERETFDNRRHHRAKLVQNSYETYTGWTEHYLCGAIEFFPLPLKCVLSTAQIERSVQNKRTMAACVSLKINVSTNTKHAGKGEGKGGTENLGVETGHYRFPLLPPCEEKETGRVRSSSSIMTFNLTVTHQRKKKLCQKTVAVGAGGSLKQDVHVSEEDRHEINPCKQRRTLPQKKKKSRSMILVKTKQSHRQRFVKTQQNCPQSSAKFQKGRHVISNTKDTNTTVSISQIFQNITPQGRHTIFTNQACGHTL